MQDVIVGFAGGAVAELLGIFELRRQDPAELPQFLRGWFYWICALGLCGLGALMVYLYQESGVALQPLLAFNIGASAPLIVKQFTRTAPEVPPGRVG